MRFLLDTNICIYALKNRPPTVLERLRNTSPDDIAISVISLLELRHGAEKSQSREKTLAKLNLFLAPLKILHFDEEDAVTAARVRASLQLAGTPIGDFDCLIAAQALERSMTLVSNNLKEFTRVPNLTTENWALP